MAHPTQQQPYDRSSTGRRTAARSSPRKRAVLWLAICISLGIAVVLVTGLVWPGWLANQAEPPAAVSVPSAPPRVQSTPAPPPTAPVTGAPTDADPHAVAETYVQAINERNIAKEISALCTKPPPGNIEQAERDLQEQQPTARLTAPIQVSGDTATGSLLNQWTRNGRTMSYPASFTIKNNSGHWCIEP